MLMQETYLLFMVIRLKKITLLLMIILFSFLNSKANDNLFSLEIANNFLKYEDKNLLLTSKEILIADLYTNKQYTIRADEYNNMYEFLLNYNKRQSISMDQLKEIIYISQNSIIKYDPSDVNSLKEKRDIVPSDVIFLLR